MINMAENPIKDRFREKGIRIKNSPSYISKNKTISIKLTLYCTLMLVRDLKPHS